MKKRIKFFRFLGGLIHKVYGIKHFSCNMLNIKLYFRGIAAQPLVYIRDLKDRIFNQENLTKVFIIFSVGFISRVLINYFYNINVFIEYTNIISYIYYIVMAFFTIFVHDFVSYLRCVNISYFNHIFILIIKGLNNFIMYLFSFSFFHEKIKCIPAQWAKIINNNKVFKVLIWLIKFVVNGVVSYYYKFKDVQVSAVKPFNISSSNSINIEKDCNNQGNTHRHRTIRRINNENNLRNINRDQAVQQRNDMRSEKVSNKGVVLDNKKVTSENNQTTLSNSSALTPTPRYFIFESSQRLDSVWEQTSFSVGNNVASLSQEIRMISTNQTNPSQSSLNDSSSRLQDRQPEQVSAFSIDNQSRVSTQSGKNERLIHEVDNTGVRGNQHNSGNWNYVSIKANSPNTSVNTINGSIAEPSKISSVNSSTIGRNVGMDLELRRNHIAYNMRQIDLDLEQLVLDQNATSLTEEIVLSKKGVLYKIKLCFKYIDSRFNNIETIYIKYDNIGKRKLFWTLVEKNNCHYASYNEFKNYWNPDTKLWK